MMWREREVFQALGCSEEPSTLPWLLKILAVLGSKQWGRGQEVGGATEKGGDKGGG